MENIKKSLESLLPAMRDAGIVSITAEYGGYGDSWDGMGYITAIDSQNKEVKITAPLERAAQDLVVELVEMYHAGFENGEGGQGKVTVDLRRTGEEIVIEHSALETLRDEEDCLLSASTDEQLAQLFDAHASAALQRGIHRAHILIEGYGDSGQTEEIDEAAKPFEDWAYEFLEEKLPGWEIDEGGGASCMIDFKRREVVVHIWSNTAQYLEPEVHTLSLQGVLEEADQSA